VLEQLYKQESWGERKYPLPESTMRGTDR